MNHIGDFLRRPYGIARPQQEERTRKKKPFFKTGENLRQLVVLQVASLWRRYRCQLEKPLKMYNLSTL